MNRLLILATLSVTLFVPFGSLLASAPKAGAPVLVLLPPWVDGPSVVEAAGGRVIGPMSAPFALLAYGDDPGFADRLQIAGALNVSDASILSELCGATP